MDAKQYTQCMMQIIDELDSAPDDDEKAISCLELAINNNVAMIEDMSCAKDFFVDEFKKFCNDTLELVDLLNQAYNEQGYDENRLLFIFDIRQKIKSLMSQRGCIRVVV